MKPVVLLLCCIALMASLPIAGVQTPKVQSVYLLPMTGGLDQFLANRLTSEGVVQVVTDPKKADAVLTDQIGEVFEKRLADLYPAETPAETKPAAAAPEKPEKPEKPENAEKKETATSGDSEATQEARKTRERPVRLFSSGRARGTLFLVDAHTRNVIWSAFEKPKNTTAEQMDRTARRIAERLKKELTGVKERRP